MICAMMVLGLGVDLRTAYMIFPSGLLVMISLFGIMHNDIKNIHSW